MLPSPLCRVIADTKSCGQNLNSPALSDWAGNIPNITEGQKPQAPITKPGSGLGSQRDKIEHFKDP